MIEAKCFYGLVVVALLVITAFKSYQSKAMNNQINNLGLTTDDMNSILSKSKPIVASGVVFIFLWVLFASYCAFLVLLSIGIPIAMSFIFCLLLGVYCCFVMILNFSSSVVIKSGLRKKKMIFGTSE